MTLALLLVSAACQLLDSAETDTALAPTEAIPTVAPQETVDAAAASVESGTPAPASEQNLTLNVWVDAPLSIEDGELGAERLLRQISGFDSTRPNVTVDVQLKQIAGAGGSLDYLRTGRDVAEDVLPDVVLLPVELLPLAVADQIIYPLDAFFNGESLFAAAAEMSEVNGALYGYPIILTDVHHFVYTTNILDETAPLRWDDLLSNEQVRLIFAGDSDDAALLIVQQYLASNGRLTNATGELALQAGPLTKALGRISAGRNGDTILAVSAETTNSAAALTNLRAGIANSALITAQDYMAEIQLNSAYTVGPIPGGDGAATQLVSAWAWAISTPDSAEQQIAAEFIGYMTAPDTLGVWALETNQIPARRDALDVWSDEAYVALLKEQLNIALPYPDVIDAGTATILQQSVTDLMQDGGDVTILAEEIIGRIEDQ